MENRSVAEIEGAWKEPELNSGLIQRLRANWSKPIGRLDNHVLATFIRQRLALDLTIPEAEHRIAAGIRDETEIHDDELATAIALVREQP
ncbi:MAG: hypothetical protein JNM58_10505 [Xanthomonadaceae bacterium]|nr:hypothetical protein [Xanthomonadaceae bacterium]